MSSIKLFCFYKIQYIKNKVTHITITNHVSGQTNNIATPDPTLTGLVLSTVKAFFIWDLRGELLRPTKVLDDP